MLDVVDTILGEKQAEVVKRLAYGQSVKKIAAEMGLPESTVRSYHTKAVKKLKDNEAVHKMLAAFAFVLGDIDGLSAPTAFMAQITGATASQTAAGTTTAATTGAAATATTTAAAATATAASSAAVGGLAAIGSTKVIAAIVVGALALGGGVSAYQYKQYKAAEEAAIVQQQEEAAEAARMAEEAAAAEAARLAEEAAQREREAEAARIAAEEEQARQEAEAKAAAEKAEAERLAAEEAARLEAERLAAEAEAARIAEEEAAAQAKQEQQPEATPEPTAQEQPSGAGMVLPNWTSPLAGQPEPVGGIEAVSVSSSIISSARWNQAAGAWEATTVAGSEVWIAPNGHMIYK
jgi:DNA-binding CsgD family transcriptional regulator